MHQHSFKQVIFNRIPDFPLRPLPSPLTLSVSITLFLFLCIRNNNENILSIAKMLPTRVYFIFLQLSNEKNDLGSKNNTCLNRVNHNENLISCIYEVFVIHNNNNNYYYYHYTYTGFLVFHNFSEPTFYNLHNHSYCFQTIRNDKLLDNNFKINICLICFFFTFSGNAQVFLMCYELKFIS